MLGLSGADAVTVAMKTAMLATGRPGVIAFHGSYHGLSHAPLAACGLKESFRSPFEAQLNPHVTFVGFPRAGGDGAALDACMMQVIQALGTGKVGAILLEPILGRGGVIVPPAGLLERLRAACHAAGALLIVDEIWTGIGRSGAMLVSTEAGVVPDLLCIGKGLGGGVPISACIGSGEVMRAWGAHGGETLHTATHFGAPPACLAALAVLDTLAHTDLPSRARDLGADWRREIEAQTAGLGVREVRGRGLMVGVELEGGAPRALTAMRRLLSRGWIVLTGGVDGATLTLTPPLTIAPSLLEAFVPELAVALSS
jgi:4-aminobutyrate aminotransferase/(S)-3-amino-2-methylpropionate transaminase